jgi:hypothetical protein
LQFLNDGRIVTVSTFASRVSLYQFTAHPFRRTADESPHALRGEAHVQHLSLHPVGGRNLVIRSPYLLLKFLLCHFLYFNNVYAVSTLKWLFNGQSFSPSVTTMSGMVS